MATGEIRGMIGLVATSESAHHWSGQGSAKKGTLRFGSNLVQFLKTRSIKSPLEVMASPDNR